MILNFEISNMGLMFYFLGNESDQGHQGVFIKQNNILLMLKRSKMEEYKPIMTPMEEIEVQKGRN